jgi:hypothetical protein
VQAYFRLFTGAKRLSVVPLGIGGREWFAVIALAALILLGGVFPHPWVASRHRAAKELLKHQIGHDRATITFVPRPPV